MEYERVIFSYLGCEFQTRERLAEMRLQRTYHDEHESFGIPS